MLTMPLINTAGGVPPRSAQVRQARRMQPLPLPDSAWEGNEDGAQRDRPDNTCVVCLVSVANKDEVNVDK
jgi:hypothetical protein